MEHEKSEELIKFDLYCDEFYEKIQNEVEEDLSRLKKNVEILTDLRIKAAEMEVETAALYHAALLLYVEELETLNKKFEKDFSHENTETVGNSKNQ